LFSFTTALIFSFRGWYRKIPGLIVYLNPISSSTVYYLMKNNNLTEDVSLSGFRFFQSLTDDEMKSLNNEKVCAAYKKGVVLYKEGSRLTGFYCITKGIVKIYKTGIDGKEQIIRFAKKGDIIAYRSLLSQESACTSAKTIEESTLCHIPYKTLLSLIERNWKFSLAMLKIVCAELKEANDYITDIAQKTVRERLAEVLLLLKQEFDLDAKKRCKSHLPGKNLQIWSEQLRSQ